MSIYSKLFDWQKKIVDKYKDKSAYGLFLDMGLGKTPISLGFAEVNACTKLIVITINAKAYESETTSGSWKYWARQSSIPYNFFDKYSANLDSNPSMLLINYESLFERGARKTKRVTLKQILSDYIKTCKGHNVAIIVDESHKMKNLQSQQTCAIMLLKKELSRVAKNVYSYLLTGTPFTQGYVDLYSQLKMLGCEMTKGTFVDLFCVKGNRPGLLGWQQPIVGYKNLDALYELVHKYAITIKSEEVVNLPEKVFINHVCPESKEFTMLVQNKAFGKEITDTLKRHGIKLTTDVSSAFGIDDCETQPNRRYKNPFYRNIDFPDMKWLAETSGQFWLRSRQLSVGFNGNAEMSIWYDRTRLEMLKEFLSNNEDNYLLFYNFTPELLEIYSICEELGYNVDVYCGEIKSLVHYEKFAKLSESEKLVTKKNIILANFASGSTGMNWQEYNKCIIFSCPLYKDYEQGIKRIHRTGQKQTTFYHVFYSNNFLDESMNTALAQCQDYSFQMFESDLCRVQSIMDNK